MQKLLWATCFLICLCVCAWGLGVRVHPEVLQDLSFQKKEYYRLDLMNGNTLTGELVRKNADWLFLKSQGVSISFMRSEIAKLTPLGSSLPTGENPFSKGPRWITFSLEVGLLARFLNASKKSASSASQSSSFFDPLRPGMPLNMLTHAKNQLKKAAEAREQTQES